MKPDLLITHIGQLATVAGNSNSPKTGESMKDIGIIEDAAVAIEDGRITAVGTTRDVLNQLTAEPVSELTFAGRFAMPGFVDSHTHVVFAGSRENDFIMKLAGKTYMDILEAGGGILSTVRATRRATLEELRSSTFSGLLSMLEHGTTCVEGKSGYGLNTRDEIKMLVALDEASEKVPMEVVSTFMGAHMVPPEYEGRTDDYVDLVVSEMI
ncbi:MAG: amidohydrolase family protein, partial [Candidatus Thorarchaeota archaeon]